MSELTIVFRLRFAVALSAALCLILVFAARDAFAEEGIPAEYIVQMEPGVAPSQGQQVVADLGGQLTTGDVAVINGFGAVLQDDAAEELVNTPGVHAVTPNSVTAPEPAATVPAPNNSTAASGGLRCALSDAGTVASRLGSTSLLDVNPLYAVPLLRQPLQVTVRADRAWQRAGGRGVGVAVLDTGIAGDLPDFVTAGKSRVIASAVTNPCARNANDQVGHGTHVAGLIAGNSMNSPSLKKLQGKYMGIAPRANLISVKVSDDDGDTTVLDVINGLQFVVDHRAALGIRVVNLSLSSTVAESYKTDPLNAAVEAAWFSGIVVVAAAGNDGAASDAVSYSPGNDPFAISVGALDDRGTTRLDDDQLASWSSRGVTQDGVQKPEVLAPGNRLIAPLAPNSDFERLCRRCMISHSYFRVSGTSMATGVVSGVVALVIEKNPGMTPNQVKGALLSTLRNVPGVGAAVDANAAIDGSGSANAGLVPNSLVDPTTGAIDWARASFRRASFRDAAGSPFGALWARASFRCDCGLDASGEVDANRVSFRRVSFRRTVDFTR
jgi:serine protease AprX